MQDVVEAAAIERVLHELVLHLDHFVHRNLGEVDVEVEDIVVDLEVRLLNDLLSDNLLVSMLVKQFFL